MKIITSLVAATVLAAGLTACASTQDRADFRYAGPRESVTSAMAGNSSTTLGNGMVDTMGSPR